jgi:hypothetical protein
MFDKFLLSCIILLKVGIKILNMALYSIECIQKDCPNPEEREKVGGCQKSSCPERKDDIVKIPEDNNGMIL